MSIEKSDVPTNVYHPKMITPGERFERIGRLMADMRHTLQQQLSAWPGKEIQFDDELTFERSSVNCYGVRSLSDARVELITDGNFRGKPDYEPDLLTDDELVNINDLNNLCDRVWNHINIH